MESGKKGGDRKRRGTVRDLTHVNTSGIPLRPVSGAKEHLWWKQYLQIYTERKGMTVRLIER